MITQIVLVLILVLMAIVLCAVIAVLCYTFKEMFDDWRQQRNTALYLRSTAKYEFVDGFDGAPVKIAINHAGLRTMTEAELNRVIDYYDERDMYLAKLERDSSGLGV